MTSKFANALIEEFLSSPVVEGLLPTSEEDMESYTYNYNAYFFSDGFDPLYSCGGMFFNKKILLGLYSLGTQYFRKNIFGLLPEWTAYRGYYMPKGGVTREDGVPYISSSTFHYAAYQEYKPSSGIGWVKKVTKPQVADEMTTQTFGFDAVTINKGDGVYYLGELEGNDTIVRNITLGNGIMENAIPNSQRTYKGGRTYPTTSLSGGKFYYPPETDPDFWYVRDANGNTTYQDFSKAVNAVEACVVICGEKDISDANTLLQSGVVAYEESWFCKWGMFRAIKWDGSTSTVWTTGTTVMGFFTLYADVRYLTRIEKARYEYKNSKKTKEDMDTYVSAFSGIPGLSARIPGWRATTRLDYLREILTYGYIPDPVNIFSCQRIKNFDVALRKGKKYQVYLIMNNYLRKKDISSISFTSIPGKWMPPKIPPFPNGIT